MSPIKKLIDTYLNDKIILLSYLFILLHFLFNFLTLPALKWLFAVEMVMLFIVAIGQPIHKLVVPLLGFVLIEGQGRILWEYNPIIKNSLDISLILALISNTIRDRKLLPLEKLPKYLILLIALHFSWYLLQLFNYDNVGLIGVLAASKIYIFPFLFFFLFLKISPDKIRLESIQSFIIFVVFLEVALIIFQVFGREEQLLAISQYYAVPMKGIFIEQAFRPFGTSFVPGGISVTFVLLLPLILMKKIRSKGSAIAIFLVIVGSWVSLFFLQVRSAMLKHFLIIAVFILFQFLVSRYKINFLFKAIVAITTLTILLFNISFFEAFFSEVDLTYSTERFNTITSDISKLDSKRLSLSDGFDILSDKLSNAPLGLGPGRTGAAVAFSFDIIQNHPLFNLKNSWASDNLLISLAIDLGIGMVFYVAILLIFPAFITYRLLKYFHRWNESQRNILVLCSIVLFVLLISNWGAIGIPYNPESFFFWFFVALGVNQTIEPRRS